MSDNHHLSPNENLHQHPQEFYSLLNQSSTESPSTTASPISPMTTIAHHQNPNWPSLGQSFDQHHYYYDMNQQPLQDQHWPNIYLPGQAYPQFNTPPPQPQHHQRYYHESYSYQMPATSPALYTTHMMDNSFNVPMPIEGNGQAQRFAEQSSASSATQIDQHYPIQYKKDKIKRPQKNDNEISATSPSKTPIPSPIISGKRKRRASTQLQQRKRFQTDTQDSNNLNDETDGDTRATTSRRPDNIKDTQSNQTVDQLENELAFLRDECATILIMLDSLRNAFLADIPSARTSISTVKSNSLSATINFMVEDIGALSTLNTTTATTTSSVDRSSATNNVDKRRRSKTMAQNPEMEREMRIAYDDLMLQVRQLEKKVERLEGKSKHVCLEDASINNATNHEDQMANLNDDLQDLQDLQDYADENEHVDSGDDSSGNPKEKKQQ